MREYNVKMDKAKKDKEFFYVGIAHTTEEGHRIVKIGTTNNPPRRRNEHRRHTYKPANFSLADFEYLQLIKLSAANTKRLEDCVRAQLREDMQDDEEYIQNDRFIIRHDEEIKININITPKKTYTVFIPQI